MATARWRLRRLIPHYTAWRSLSSAVSNFGGRPPREPRFLRLAIWSQSFGYPLSIPGPLVVGALCQHNGGWQVPLLAIMVLTLAQVGPGLAALTAAQ